MELNEHWTLLTIIAAIFVSGVSVLIFAERRFMPRSEIEPKLKLIEDEQTRRVKATEELQKQIQEQLLLMTKMEAGIGLLRQEIRFLRREMGSKTVED